jgi:hypothetical protein
MILLHFRVSDGTFLAQPWAGWAVINILDYTSSIASVLKVETFQVTWCNNADILNKNIQHGNLISHCLINCVLHKN